MSRSFKRNRPYRAIGKKVLIACEGIKTEPKYFNGIRISLRLSSVQIRIVPHEGTDPLTIVRAVINERESARKQGSWNVDDQAWAVFDGDEHIEHNPEAWNNAIQLANSRGIFLAISNPCFEYWYLLHYEEHFGNLNRERARQLLKRHLPGYEKHQQLFPNPLKPLTQDAIERSKRLALYRQDAAQIYSNPCCHGVADLVEILLSLQTAT